MWQIGQEAPVQIHADENVRFVPENPTTEMDQNAPLPDRIMLTQISPLTCQMTLTSSQSGSTELQY